MIPILLKRSLSEHRRLEYMHEYSANVLLSAYAIIHWWHHPTEAQHVLFSHGTGFPYSPAPMTEFVKPWKENYVFFYFCSPHLATSAGRNYRWWKIKIFAFILHVCDGSRAQKGPELCLVSMGSQCGAWQGPWKRNFKGKTMSPSITAINPGGVLANGTTVLVWFAGENSCGWLEFIAFGLLEKLSLASCC